MRPVGYLEIMTINRISGWAWNEALPDAPVDVAVQAGDRTILTIRADRARDDLAQAGLGNGHHGFDVTGLHELIPWSLNEVSVCRLPDGAELNGSPGVLVCTDGPHLLLVPGSNEWFVSMGPGVYRLHHQAAAIDCAAYLPVSIREASDENLPVLGVTSLIDDQDGPVLLLQRSGAVAPWRLPLDERELRKPQIRWCLGGPGANSWTRADMVLEVENTLGLELTCFLPPVPGAGSKRLRVSSEVCVPLDFDLARGAHTAVGFRVPSIRRHRIRMTSDLENGSDREQGFQLRGLAAVAPPFEGIND